MWKDWFNDTDEISDYDYRTVEHILPKEWVKIQSWNDQFGQLTKVETNLLLHSLGNLLPLSSSKNGSLQNKSFQEKVIEYRRGTFSELEVTQKYTEWTPKTILERNIELFKFIQKRWPSESYAKKKSDSEILEYLGLNKLEKYLV